MKRRSTAFFFLSVVFILLFGCKSNSGSIARIWTNQSEFAAYAELFNISQNHYRIVVEYKENPSEALINTRNNPDIVIGSWLKGEKARAHIIPIDYLFNELRINSRLFYQPLLDLGSIKRRQYLLPVSFNLPAMLFSQEKSELMENNFSISLEHIQALSREFNTQEDGLYTRMGFSPRWDSEFLYLTTQMFNAHFEEGQNFLVWNEKQLSSSIEYLRNWSRSINESIRTEEDFQFKFLYDPPYRLVTAGRNLFSYISSDELCVLPHDKLQNIDFRWLTKDAGIPVRDDIVYLGICKKAENLPAAEAFVVWFFKEETQRALLERSREMGILDQSFGISGGFSSIQTINERTFPLFYPFLFGHLPPQDSLEVPRILPNNWEQIKDSVIIPFLEAAVKVDPPPENPNQYLNTRLSAWRKKI
ncbi:MAG TPA: carbohydrate ABC transporter substrate-binding protein [Treponema sp.]|nr:carbohydrate ABC transporter substrate-binding protein [Treponema sp.]